MSFFFSRYRSGKKWSMAGNTSIEGEYTRHVNYHLHLAKKKYYPIKKERFC